MERCRSNPTAVAATAAAAAACDPSVGASASGLLPTGTVCNTCASAVLRVRLPRAAVVQRALLRCTLASAPRAPIQASALALMACCFQQRWRRRPRRHLASQKCLPRGRREYLGSSAAAALWGAVAATGTAPQAAHAGAWTAFLTDILPIREGQREMAKFDYALRDNWNSFLDAVNEPPPAAPDVPDAAGAEAAVITAADAAVAAAGVNLKAVVDRSLILGEEESRRLRGRSASAVFETELVGSVISHLASRTDSYAFRAYCRWRAYLEGLQAVGPLQTGIQTFGREFGRCLTADGGLLGGLPSAPRLIPKPSETQQLVKGLESVLSATVTAGLCTRAQLDADEVLVDLWATGGRRDLVLPMTIEGDPLVDAQLLLSEENATNLTPDPIVAALEAWLGPNNSSVCSAKLDSFYVNSRWRRKREKEAFVYVPKQRLLQLTLQTA